MQKVFRMKDSLGDRMKSFYEDRFRYMLPRRSYTIVRIDGKAFHTYTRGLKKPFDEELVEDMNHTAIELCKGIIGAKLAYVQSDEISVIITDFDTLETESWFNSNLQKICSVSSSIATLAFNERRILKWARSERTNSLPKGAHFDSRVFQIPCKTEVENYMIWRQQDAVRNSISSVAQSLYSHKELHGKSSNEMQELIFAKGTNWNDFDPGMKRGRLIIKMESSKRIDDETLILSEDWSSIPAPIFTRERKVLDILIPNLDPRE